MPAARVSGEHNQIHAHFHGTLGVFRCGIAAPAHGPDGFLVLSTDSRIHRLQIDADHPPGEFLHPAHHVLGAGLGQAHNAGLPHVEHIQKQQIRAHGGSKLRVGHIAEQRRGDADGLGGKHPALAAGHRLQQFFR